VQTFFHAQCAANIDPAAVEAGQRSQETLLNCYCREVAGPAGELSVGPLFWQNDWPTAIKLARQREGGQILHIQLPYSGERIVAVVAAASPTGNYRYRSPFFHKAAAKPWALLDWESQAAVLLRELSLRHGVAPNTELMEQIRDSVAMTTLSLAHRRADHLPADPLQAFVASEQALVYGHPFHPAPKSRQGFAPQDLLRYSPELGAAFPLHWFAVPAEDVVQQSLLAQRCEEVVAAAGVPAVEAGEVAIPVHPWQAGYLRRLPLVRAALASGRLRDLGAHGAPFHATSSVRTLYQPGNPFFYKFSLNVRLTNCVRKNAWYELEGAIQVSRVMRGLLPSLQREFAGLEVLEEPAFLSVDLRDTDATRNREVVEGFGMILRRSVEPLLQAGTVPLLAGALFGNHVLGEQRTRQLLAGIAAREASPIAAVTEHWFSRYVALVMYPVLHCYFAHGVVFEPHLQNVLLGLGDGAPDQLFLRDFEGVKLLPQRHPAEDLGAISQRAREALWYGEEQGWKRVAYCLFVNNFAEAIHQLAADSPGLERRLWAVVRHHLHRYQAHWGSPASARRINGVLAGEPFPGKTNLSNRFLQRADRAADYVPVGNPIGMVGDAAWS
jgi:siderophore synthetase component